MLVYSEYGSAVQLISPVHRVRLVRVGWAAFFLSKNHCGHLCRLITFEDIYE